MGCANFNFSAAAAASGLAPSAELQPQHSAERWILARAVSLSMSARASIRHHMARVERASASANASSPMVPPGLYTVASDARRRWSDMAAAHVSLSLPAECGAFNSPQALLERLYPRDGYHGRPPSSSAVFSLLGWDMVFRVDEPNLVEAPTFAEFMREVCASLLLGLFISLFMLLVESTLFVSGYSSELAGG